MLKNILLKSITIPFYLYLKIQPYFDKLLGNAMLMQLKGQFQSCRFEGAGRIYFPEKIEIGSDVHIGKNFFCNAKGGLKIGDYTRISRNVTIHTVNHNYKGDLLPYDRNDICNPICIGNYVWIGMNVSILSGVKIGDGAIIGTGTIVTKDIKEGQIVVGHGQRIVGNRNSDRFDYLINNKKFLKNK